MKSPIEKRSRMRLSQRSQRPERVEGRKRVLRQTEVVMTVRLLVLSVVALAASISLMAQDRGQQQYNAAYDAWDAGRYPEALKGFQQLLGTPDGERFVEPIALLTGELYRSIEVVPPNRLVVDSSAAVNGPQWSPDGRHFAFESTAAGRRTIRIYRIENGASLPVATLDGHAVSFAFDGTRVAFLRIIEDEELKAARAAGGGPGSSAAVRNLEAAKVAVIERDLTSGPGNHAEPTRHDATPFRALRLR